MRVSARNLVLEDGEIDIVARDGSQLVAVEVRTITGGGDPIDAIDGRKRLRVRRLGARIGASRVDFIGIAIGTDGIEVHWVPG